MTDPMRLGFAVKVLGESGLKSNDARKWQSEPHLRVSIECLHAVFGYLVKHDITVYRMSSDVVPYVTHPTMPQFHGQVKECRMELEALGKVAREQHLRLRREIPRYAPEEAERFGLTAGAWAADDEGEGEEGE